ncbi:hypothetical protein Tco_0299123 [Tanacetum coccineum]
MSKCCVSNALTKQPSTYYYEYHREFWYSAEVDTTYTITFNLSCFDKPLSFNLGDFSSITELKYSENYDTLPLKETVRAGLATLGLVDEKNLDLSSTNLVNSSPLKIRYFSRICRMLHVVKCLGGVGGLTLGGRVTYSRLRGLTLGGGVALFGLGGFTLGGGVTYAGVGGLTLGGVIYSGLGGLTLAGGVALFGLGGFTLGGGVTYAGVGGLTLGGVTYSGLGGLTLGGAGIARFGGLTLCGGVA